MATTKASQKAVNKYIKNNYDTTVVRFKKGELDKIKSHAEQQGKSLNAYINDLIKADMNKSS